MCVCVCVLKRYIDVEVKRDERLVLVAQGDVERDLRRGGEGGDGMQ